jgi:Coenzyme PQQ synthesis protein D (PqqD)
MASLPLPSPDPDVVSRRLGDEVVLVDLRTNRIFALSPTGARFWELLSEGKSRPEIEEQLLREYEVARETVSAEIDSLVRALEDERLVGEG